jgi:hypothetical protein
VRHRHRQSVRPWNAFSKTTTPGLPVAARAILTAFSTGLGAAVQEQALLVGAGARRELCEPSARLDVRFVDPDHEALMEIRVDLLVHGRDRRGLGRARVLAAEPACEIDVRLAVDVLDPGAARARDDDRRGRDPARHELLAAARMRSLSVLCSTAMRRF